jgi:hypothetical protein
MTTENNEFDFNLSDMDLNFEFDSDIFEIGGVEDDEIRYMKAKLLKNIPDQNIKYSYAVDLARDLKLEPGGRANVIVNGCFVFGDFIEAYIKTHNIKVNKLTITTLSMSQENIDSLRNLLTGGYVDQLNLITSHYWFSHEKYQLVPYLYKQLDFENKFQLAICGAHTKTCIFDTLGGKKIVIHGSANLRSSANVEQFTIEDNPELFDFYDEYQTRIIDKFKTINKAVRGVEHWNLITNTESHGRQSNKKSEHRKVESSED